MADSRYESYMGLGPRRMAHMEHWSCPDAETYLTGIDYYDHPRQCRLRLAELYPQLRLRPPDDDTPIPRPALDLEAVSSNAERQTVRWGDGESWTFEHGQSRFLTPEDVFSYSPLAHADLRAAQVVENWDYASEDALYQQFRARYPDEWQRAPEGQVAEFSFYNTMFMWPLLTFGWEMFLRCCLDPRFERVMDEFAEINRRVFRAVARLPINFCVCHDDIAYTKGPVCSPRWMRKYIFPRYEEFWGIVKDAGMQVLFISDGNMDAYADDVIACGSRGIISEPYTDWKALARRHPTVLLAGEGDNRVLVGNRPAEIRAMVDSMVATGRQSAGYMLCIGNHIPWNTPPAAIKLYLDYAAEVGYRY
jgi:hypothetical protein